jgi:tetrahydromethanopterin S-methyltransferase subunit C
MTARYDFGTALAGVVFMALGVGFLLDRLDVIELRTPVTLALGVIGLGAAMLVGALINARR